MRVSKPVTHPNPNPNSSTVTAGASGNAINMTRQGISKNAPVLQAIIRAYKGPLPNHFDPCIACTTGAPLLMPPKDQGGWRMENGG